MPPSVAEPVTPFNQGEKVAKGSDISTGSGTDATAESLESFSNDQKARLSSAESDIASNLANINQNRGSIHDLEAKEAGVESSVNALIHNVAQILGNPANQGHTEVDALHDPAAADAGSNITPETPIYLTRQQDYEVSQYVSRGHVHTINPPEEVNDATNPEYTVRGVISYRRPPGIYVAKDFSAERHLNGLIGGEIIRRAPWDAVIPDINPHGLCAMYKMRRVGNGGRLEMWLNEDILKTYKTQRDIGGTIYGALDPAQTTHLSGHTDDIRGHRITFFGYHPAILANSGALHAEYIIASDRHLQSQNLVEIVLSPTNDTFFDGIRTLRKFYIPPDGPDTLTVSDQTDFSSGFSIRDHQNFGFGLTNTQANEVDFQQDNSLLRLQLAGRQRSDSVPGGAQYNEGKRIDLNPDNVMVDASGRSERYPADFNPMLSQSRRIVAGIYYNRSDRLSENVPSSYVGLEVNYYWEPVTTRYTSHQSSVIDELIKAD